MLPSCQTRGTDHQQVVRLIHWLNYLLLIAAVISVVLTLEIRRPPSSWGWAFIMVAILSMLSAVIACLSSFENSIKFFVHLFLLISSLIGQGACFLMPFAHTDLNSQYLSPHKFIPRSRTLLKSDAVLFICMFCIQLGVLILACAAYNCNFDDDFVDLEASKRRKRLAKVQQEASAETAERNKKDSAEQMDRKMDEKNGQWATERQDETER